MLNIIPIDLQGRVFTLLVINIHTVCLKKIHVSLLEKKKQLPYFFSKKVPVVINVSKINNQINWKNLHQILSDAGLFIIGVCSCYDKELKNTIIKSGLPILQKGKNIINFHDITHIDKTSYNNNISNIEVTQIIHKPIRSGQRIYAQNRDLIIISNVNSGAEVISDGNIHVYGIMRGKVLAGASGYKKSQIFCSNLFSELISIGGYYKTSEQIPKNFLGESVRIYLKDKNLIITKIL